MPGAVTWQELLPRTEGFCAADEPLPGHLRHCRPGDSHFPPRLLAFEETTPLWIRSRLDPGLIGGRLWNPPAVAIVGTRSASAVGRDLAREIAWGLARAGVVIVSGLALGIDGAAHEGALLAGGRTIAVLGCGLDRCYPAEHVGLARDITARGALISEWSPGTAPVAWRFPRRNRLISGLADAVLFVEGGAKSGAVHTVRFALDQGRDVLVVPRDPGPENNTGPNRMLREGATAVTTAGDILERMGWAAGPPAGTRAGAHSRERRAPADGARPLNRSDLRGRILGLIVRCPGTSTETLLQKMPEECPAQLVAELTRLEVEGRLYQDGQGSWREDFS